MRTSTTAWKPGDLVPLDDRLRYMQMFRLLTGVLVTAIAALVPVPSGRLVLSVATLGYLFVTGAAYSVWRLIRRRGLFLFGATLMLDGIYLAWASYATGEALSPVRLLIFVNVIAVALLGSYRTALKIAFWHSLLLGSLFYVEQVGLLRAAAAGTGPASGLPGLAAFLAMVWLVALATATFSSVNERELRRRRYDLEALARLTSGLETRSSPQAVAHGLLDNLAETFDVQSGAVLDATGGQVTVIGERGIDSSGGQIGRLGALGAKSLLRHAWETRETMLVSGFDPIADPWAELLMPGVPNLLLVPMSSEGRCIGLLVVRHSLRSGSRIERRVVSMVERFVSYAALVLHNVQLLAQTQQLAMTDALTGLANRRSMEDALVKDLARAERSREALSFVLIDIDKFKAVNDRFGHQTGDEVLAAVARIAKQHSRSFDTVARYGGEELALVLPGCDQSAAVEVAERVRLAVREMDGAIRVTVSAGVATYPTDATSQESLIRVADQALYEAKKAGRNRVVATQRSRNALAPVLLHSTGPPTGEGTAFG